MVQAVLIIVAEYEGINVNRCYVLTIAAALLTLMPHEAFAWTDLVGLANKHPLSQTQVGELLIEELRCGSCHASQKPLLERPAPDLSDVGGRVDSNYLQRFLANPSDVHSGSEMPNVLAMVPNSERETAATALTHYLVHQSTNKFQNNDQHRPDSERSEVGKQLFHSVGCVACHAPRENKTRQLTPEEQAREDEREEAETPPNSQSENARLKTGVVELGHVPSKYNLSSLSGFLFQPLKVRSSGRMPDMKLTPEESKAIAEYLLHDQESKHLAFQIDKKLVEVGKKYFDELNCAACHRLDNAVAKPAVVELRKADLTRGCLAKSNDRSAKGNSSSPRFSLSTKESDAILAALKVPEHVDSDDVEIAKTLTRFNCIACHIRDDFGGVAEDRSAYFETSEKNLGEDGRIPPPLTLLGAKLRPEWLKKVLFDGESVRPYMSTRMPQYGEPNLRRLPELVRRVDKLESEVLRIPSPESDTKEKSKADREREKLLRTAGRELLGQQGVYCVACHNFNGKPAPVNKGIDLMTSFERLEPGWFNNFVRNPGKYRPRIVMPYSWPDGVAAHDKILDGDTQMQIEAIWYYLSLGTSAADPPGIRRIDTVLSVGETARTYRGRSSVAGFRGIAVGFPEKLSYAFNAETGTLSAIWQGDFIRVDRGGQGSGGFNPSAQAVQMAQDVSFIESKDDSSPWPLRPVMTKEAPANPNPLYPKNLGYQFRGYYLDDAQVPTFMYRSGDVEIEDRSVAVQGDKQLQLVRTIQFNSPRSKELWFRALTGETEKLKAESELNYATDRLRVTIPKTPSILRSAANVTGAAGPSLSELILKIEIPQGQSKLSLTYELLKKQ